MRKIIQKAKDIALTALAIIALFFIRVPEKDD